jgi:hypothetical protein
VLELTLIEPPTQFGATHWSSRLLATALAAEGTPISHVTIARIWHRFGVQPWRAGTFKFSTDPELEGKIRDVVGLYLHPPEKAVVLCVDEKPQVQALERTARPPRGQRSPPPVDRHPGHPQPGGHPPGPWRPPRTTRPPPAAPVPAGRAPRRSAHHRRDTSRLRHSAHHAARQQVRNLRR